MVIFIFLGSQVFSIDGTVIGIEMHRADVMCTPMLTLEYRQTLRMEAREVRRQWLHDGHDNV